MVIYEFVSLLIHLKWENVKLSSYGQGRDGFNLVFLYFVISCYMCTCINVYL